MQMKKLKNNKRKKENEFTSFELTILLEDFVG